MLDGVIFYDDSEKCFRGNGRWKQLEARLKAAHLPPRESFIGIIPLWRAKIICLSRAAHLRTFYEICLPGLMLALKKL